MKTAKDELIDDNEDNFITYFKYHMYGSKSLITSRVS